MKNNMFFKIIFLLIVILTSTQLFSQSSCATATPVTDLTGVVCASSTVSSVSTMSSSTCVEGTYDTWFSFVAQGSVADITVTASTSGFRPEITIAESDNNTCTGNFAEVACLDGSANYNVLTGTGFSGLVPGNTYWILISSNGDVTTGTLDVCVTNPPTPVNDDCLGAITLPLNGTCVNGTTVNANDEYTGAAGCQNSGVSSHPDVFYSFVADKPSLSLTITTGSMTGNAELVLYTGDCLTTFTPITSLCGTMPMTDTMNALVVGATYYIGVSSDALEGTFQLCATSFTPLATPGQNCPDADAICSSTGFTVGTVAAGGGTITGNGSAEDLTFTGSCFGGQESRSQWYKFSVNTAGDLEFQIDPILWGDDYDWAVFDITTSGCVINGNVPIVCNWSGCYGVTGVTSNVSAYTGGATSAFDYYYANPAGPGDCLGLPGAGDGSSQWENAVNLIAGHQYAVLINNYGSAASDNGFNFSFNGTGAGIGVLAGFKLTGGGCTDYNVTIQDTVAALNSSTYTWDWGDGSAIAVGPSTNTHDYTAAGPGTYSVHITVTDLAGCVKDYYQTVTVGTTIAADAGSNTTICINTTQVIGGAPSATGGDGNYTYSWTNAASLDNALIANPTATVSANTTYTLTVTDGLGCTATDAVTITVDQLPTAVAGGSQTICVSGTATVSGATASNGTIAWTENGAGSITAGNTSLTPVYTPAVGDIGVPVTLTMTVTSMNSCPSPTPVTYSVTVDALSTASAGGSQTICTNGSATVSGATVTNGTVVWSENGAGSITSNGTTLTPTYTAASGDAGNTVTLTMTVTSSNACPAPAPVTYSVVVPANLVYTVVGTDPLACNGTDGFMTISGLGNTVNYNVTYMSGLTTVGPNPYTSNASGEIVIPNLGAGTYNNFSIQVVSTTCTTTNNTTVSLSNPGAPNVFDITNVVQCAGTSYQLLTINGTTLSGSEAYYDAPGNTGNLITVGTVFTTDTIVYIYDESGVCSDQEVFSITFNPLPTATAGGSQTICETGTATVSGATASNGTIAWTENGAGTITSGGTTLTPVYTPAVGDIGGAVTLTMTVTSSNICPSPTPVSYTVNVNGLSTATAGGSQTICESGTATLSGASAANGTIVWTENGTGSITSGGTTLTPVYTATSGDAGNAVTLTMTVTSTNACPSPTPVTYTVNVDGLSSASAGGSQTICQTGTVTVSGATATNGTIAWTENGAGSITSGGTTLTPVYTASSGDAGNAVTLTMTVTSTNACPSPTPVTYTVNVNGLSTATAGGSQTICESGTATLSGATATNGTIAWTENGTGSITSGGTTLTPIYTPSSGDAGNNITLTMTVTSSNSCPSPSPVIYTVAVDGLSTAIAGGSQTICSDGTATVSGASSTNGTIVWTENGSGSITTGGTTLAPVYTAASGDAGNTVTLTMTVTSSNACPSPTPVTYNVIVNLAGDPSFTITDYCEGATNSINITGDLGGTFTFNPAVSDGATINSTTGIISNGIGGTQYNVEYTTNGCVASLVQAVNVNAIPAAPVVTGLPIGTQCIDWTPNVLTASGNNGIFNWFDNANNNVSTLNTYTPSPVLGINTYTVNETVLGCVGPNTTFNIELQICDIFVPTAFTPDNNNVDDVWELKDIDVIFPNNEVSIYNRWGALLYKSEKGKYETKPWDGKYNNEELPVASYYFIIEYNEENRENSTGTVSIIRK
jgi:gliding motility-associated-like protein